MVLWNLLDGGPSCSGPLLGPSKSMRGGTSGTNPHQAVRPPWNRGGWSDWPLVEIRPPGVVSFA
jgi:hypothetical protein